MLWRTVPIPRRSGTFIWLTALHKIRISRADSVAYRGCQGAKAASQNPLAPLTSWVALNSHQPFLGQRLTSELELTFIYEGRIPSLPLTSLDRALWLLLQCCKIYCPGLGRHLFPSDLWTLLASGRATSTNCSLWIQRIQIVQSERAVGARRTRLLQRWMLLLTWLVFLQPSWVSILMETFIGQEGEVFG